MVTTAQHSRPSVTIRPGVEMPDWSAVASPRAEEALAAIVNLFRFTDGFTGFSAQEDLVRRTLIALYGKSGGAPSAAEIAEAAGLEQAQTEAALEALRRRDMVVLDKESGAIKGAYPFTERETEHRIKLGDATLNAMCAVDAFGTGAMFARDCEIESSCRHCGEPVRVTTADHGERLKSFEPDTAMVWIGIYYEGQAATSLCTVIAYFCSPAHSEQWFEGRENSNGYALTVAGAMEVGKSIFRPVFAGD